MPSTRGHPAQDVRLGRAAGRGGGQPPRAARHRRREISWDAFRREDGTWRIVATWPSGKATAQAAWDLDKGRQVVSPHDDMAQYLCAERPTQILGQDPAPERAVATNRPAGPRPARHDARLRTDPWRSRPAGCRAHGARPTRDPIRAGRDALLASLDRPLGPGARGRGLDRAAPGPGDPVPGGAAALLGGGSGSAFDDDADLPKEAPAVPSLAVLRPRRTVGQPAAAGPTARRGQASQAVAELGRRPLRRRSRGARILLIDQLPAAWCSPRPDHSGPAPARPATSTARA